MKYVGHAGLPGIFTLYAAGKMQPVPQERIELYLEKYLHHEWGAAPVNTLQGPEEKMKYIFISVIIPGPVIDKFTGKGCAHVALIILPQTHKGGQQLGFSYADKACAAAVVIHDIEQGKNLELIAETLLASLGSLGNSCRLPCLHTVESDNFV